MALALAPETTRWQGPFGLVPPPEIAIQCEAFNGTLETLIKCVIQQKVDLWDIPLHPICLAYVDYLLDQPDEDVDSVSSAMLAMAYLLERKAHRLLPLPEPIEELDGLAYEGPGLEFYQPVLLGLEESFEERQRLFFRSADAREDYEIPIDLGKITTSDLGRALEALLDKAVPELPHVSFGRPRRSLADQMKIVARCLSESPRALPDLVEGEFTRGEALWWFLALLELIRLSAAVVMLGQDGSLLFSIGKS
ncbi:MAG: segregation/condensation protein A [Fimbriimonadaceae bacterium]|nr:segregation/condensation protein A [Fimbriimonadaceae bacterium]